MIRVRDLKDQIGMPGRRPFLYCPECMERFSANKGDYFLADGDQIIKHCRVPMRLVTEHAVLTEVKS